MGPSRRLAPAFCALLWACSSGTTSTTHPDATTVHPDATADSDALSVEDGAMMSMDTGIMSLDASVRDATSVDTGVANGDGGLGQMCTELDACCMTLVPQLQGPCLMVSGAGDETACGMRYMQIQNLGQCGGPPDSGTGPRDAGPLGPACSTLNDCCAMAGQLAGLCTRVSSGGNEGTCQQILDLVQGRGLCLPMDASISDSGTSTGTMDAGSLMDSGTSTTADGG